MQRCILKSIFNTKEYLYINDALRFLSQLTNETIKERDVLQLLMDEHIPLYCMARSMEAMQINFCSKAYLIPNHSREGTKFANLNEEDTLNYMREWNAPDIILRDDIFWLTTTTSSNCDYIYSYNGLFKVPLEHNGAVKEHLRDLIGGGVSPGYSCIDGDILEREDGLLITPVEKLHPEKPSETMRRKIEDYYPISIDFSSHSMCILPKDIIEFVSNTLQQKDNKKQLTTKEKISLYRVMRIVADMQSIDITAPDLRPNPLAEMIINHATNKGFDDIPSQNTIVKIIKQLRDNL